VQGGMHMLLFIYLFIFPHLRMTPTTLVSTINVA